MVAIGGAIRPSLDVSLEQSPEDLRQIARYLMTVADAIEARGTPDGDRAQAPPMAVSDQDLASGAQSIYRSRRRRARHFDEKLFGEPAWDMLLDLFVHAARGQPLSTTSACVASGVPTTTGLRWLRLLEEAGLTRRAPDAADSRLNLVTLTPAGYAAMRAYLTEWTAN